MTNSSNSAVVLPAGHTGSSLFHAVLAEAVSNFPGALASAQFPTSAATFKREYGAALARFEAARVNARERVEIARFIVRWTQGALGFGSANSAVPLGEYLKQRFATPTFEHARLTGRAGLPIEVPLDGRRYRGREVFEAVDRLYEAHQLTGEARKGLRWIVDYAAAQGGTLDLSGQRFVIFGAGAELASTRMLLRAGASILWIDLSEPTRSLTDVNSLAGSITRAPAASNLLENPCEIAAAIRAFAVDGPVHVGMFAYAPGASKEWRLGAAMNAIVASLEPALVRSVALLISPTTPSVLSGETLRSTELRYLHSPSWQRILERTGLIQRPGHHREDTSHVSLSTVSLQGLSYQAAQYISKIAAAESYAVFGSAAQDGGTPITVSSNVAGVTRTRSLSHPLFDAAFLGADKFDVRIFDPATTRALNGLLMLHDLLNPEAPGAAATLPNQPREKASAVLAQQIHGGIYSLPFVLEGVIRAAAVVGLASRPSLLVKKPAPGPTSAAFVGEAAE